MPDRSVTIDPVAAVTPAPNQIPIFEELEGKTPPRRRHLRIQPPLLADLTARQRKAVTRGEGPLLVVAGAGTGKTTVLTRRIAWLIAEQRARPSEVLALTFTERAAAEMQERVDQLVPYGYTDSVISTFHAFGDRLIREHGLGAGLSDQVAVLSRPEQVTFLREHLDELPLDRYRPLGDPARFLSALATHFSRARDEDISPQEYRAAADRLAAQAAEAPSDLALAEEAARQAELAAAYTTYDRLLRAADRIDFGDQVGLALRLLREHPDILAEERSRYRYVLVDEFQDTNHAQFELVRLLAPAPSGNVTVVGDDDQSIYRFRGAALSNILGFRSAYPKTGRVVLTDNFRSPQPVLDVAYRLIRHNDPDRLEVRERIDKHLRARGPAQGVRMDEPVTSLAFATTSDEADGVADRIAASVAAGRRPADHAILVRGNRDADPYLRALSLRRIPWRFSGTAGLYRQPEVRVLLSVLRALNDAQDSVSLYDVATSEIFGLAPEDASRALNQASRRHMPLEAALREGVQDPSRATLHGPAAIIAQRVLAAIDAHRALAARLEAGEILYRFVTSTGWLGRLALEARESGPERLQNVARLFEILRGASAVLRDARLPFLVARLDLFIQAGDDPATADADLGGGEAVHVLTCHKAKGLEFPIVFMVGMAQDRFPTRSRRDPVDLPEDLVHEGPVDGDFHLAEERRLCYVGMTRARESLVMSWARDEGDRPRRPSQFLLEALDVAAVEADVLGRPSPIERIERLRPPAEAPPAGAGPAERRPGLVEQPLTLSYGQVNDYTECPARYRYAHLIRLPTPASHPLVVGKALHAAVQAYHRSQMSGAPLSREGLQAELDRHWESAGFVTRAHEDARRASARAALERFWVEQQADPAPVIGVEQEFAFRFGADRVRGRMDRVDRAPDGTVEVVDYKSGDVRDPATAGRRSRESLQLAIYALGWEAEHGSPPERLTLHFLESGEVGRSLATPARLDKARAQIAAAAAGIRSGDFTARPGPMRCATCPFRTICPDAAS